MPTSKLVGWSILVGGLILLGYVANLSGGQPKSDVLYEYSTAAAALLQYAVIFGFVLLIANGLSRETIGFVEPRSWSRAAALTVVSLVGIWLIGLALSPFLNAGKEQGLLPDGWQPERAGAFVANFIVIAIIAPIVEETLYRGLGFAAVASAFGPVVAILITGVAFGLSHGLVIALPVLAAFGVIIALLRWRTASLYPPIALHMIFNAAALIAAVTRGASV